MEKIKVCHLASKHKMNDMRIFEKISVHSNQIRFNLLSAKSKITAKKAFRRKHIN